MQSGICMLKIKKLIITDQCFVRPFGFIAPGPHSVHGCSRVSFAALIARAREYVSLVTVRGFPTTGTIAGDDR